MSPRRVELFELAVAHASIRDDPGKGLFPPGMLGVGADGQLSVRWGRHSLVQWDRSGTDALNALARSLHGMKGVAGRASTDEVLREVIDAVARVVDGERSSAKELAKLEASLASRRVAMVGVLAVGAVDWFGPPRLVSDTVLIGRISSEFERAVSDLGSAVGITRGFRFDVDCRWPEDMVSMRNDPDIADELDPWLPTLVAVAVDAVGSTGAYLVHQMTESILGATWLAKQAGDDWVHLPPWIIGDTVGDDEDAARAEEHEIAVFMYWHSDRKPPYNDIAIAGWNYDLHDLLQRPSGGPIRVVANSRPFRGGTSGPAARLAASCRHAVLGARLIDPAQRLVHFTSALEALVPGDEGKVVETFKVGVARLIEADPRTASHHRRTLGRIYEERSRILHEGFTRSTVEVMAARAGEVKNYLVDSALKVASLVEGGMNSDEELRAWLGT